MKVQGTLDEGGEGPIRSVYVHAPFCARRCRYCDFAVTVARRGDLSGWLGALEREIRWLGEEGELRTAGYVLHPDYCHPEEGEAPEIAGYTATNSSVRANTRTAVDFLPG